ncbi:MAG: SpoIID/LytB domain-containing protein [Candidatus Eisenbacteria bacterium]|uniref:SpoIID/LytB domain-containing protein n=1 Tax=Eiseniibacteriota bacterium TaxID=2212470 RepID=A0A7Y2H1G7_UNCEI|nr:SpoIID/LytB domain-containing protein [Candidatus Eisenbacteria bacterium]
MKRRFWFGFLVSIMTLGGCASPKEMPPLKHQDNRPPTVRVAIKNSTHEAKVGSETNFALADSEGVIDVFGGGVYLRVTPGEMGMLVQDPSGAIVARGEGPYWVRPTYGGSPVLVGKDAYTGHLVLRRGTERGIHVINVVDLETYLRSVVPLEIGHAGKYLNAAKAQSIAARTYAVRNLNKYAAEGYDLQSGVMDQVYGPISKRHPDADRAVMETRGQVLTYNSQPIRAKYSSTCGGKTAGSEEGFNYSKIPYLRPQNCKIDGRVNCRTSRYFRWDVSWSETELKDILSRTIPKLLSKPWLGERITQIKVIERGESGRAIDLQITTDKSEYVLSRFQIRQALERPEGGLLRSNAFELNAKKNNGRVTELTIIGRGWGHGVGMCQWGAMQLSTEGYDFRSILDLYYPKARLEQLY